MKRRQPQRVTTLQVPSAEEKKRKNARNVSETLPITLCIFMADPNPGCASSPGNASVCVRHAAPSRLQLIQPDLRVLNEKAFETIN